AGAEELARAGALAREAGADLVLWLAPVAEVPMLFALRPRDGRLQAASVGADEPEVAARTLALKVRSLYARAGNEREPPDWIQLP
ncbi:hypothetical protein ACSTI0_00465, partial [Vibrio parahaemolyticus]